MYKNPRGRHGVVDQGNTPRSYTVELMPSLLTSSYTPAPLKFRVIFLRNNCSIELRCKFEVK